MSDTGTTTATDPRDVEPVPGDAFGDWYSYNGKEYDTLAEAWCDYYEHCNTRLRTERDEAIADREAERITWQEVCDTGARLLELEIKNRDEAIALLRVVRRWGMTDRQCENVDALLAKYSPSPAGSRAEGSGTL